MALGSWAFVLPPVGSAHIWRCWENRNRKKKNVLLAGWADKHKGKMVVQMLTCQRNQETFQRKERMGVPMFTFRRDRGAFQKKEINIINISLCEFHWDLRAAGLGGTETFVYSESQSKQGKHIQELLLWRISILK